MKLEALFKGTLPIYWIMNNDEKKWSGRSQSGHIHSVANSISDAISRIRNVRRGLVDSESNSDYAIVGNCNSKAGANAVSTTMSDDNGIGRAFGALRRLATNISTTQHQTIGGAYIAARRVVDATSQSVVNCIAFAIHRSYGILEGVSQSSYNNIGKLRAKLRGMFTSAASSNSNVVGLKNNTLNWHISSHGTSADSITCTARVPSYMIVADASNSADMTRGRRTTATPASVDNQSSSMSASSGSLWKLPEMVSAQLVVDSSVEVVMNDDTLEVM